MSENTQDEKDLERLDRKDVQDVKTHLPALIAGEGWDIILSCGHTWKANLLAEMCNKTEDQLRSEGSSHDSLQS